MPYSRHTANSESGLSEPKANALNHAILPLFLGFGGAKDSV